jgi:hypothetical protein
MTVPSFQFLAFAFICAGLYNLLCWPAWRQSTVLAANVLFFSQFFENPYRISAVWLVSCVRFGVGSSATGKSITPLVHCNYGYRSLFAFFWLKKYIFVLERIFLTFPYVTISLVLYNFFACCT